MEIFVDENIPYARDLFNRLNEVTAVSGRPTPVAQLADVDAFTARSVTKVNESLLAGRPIKFVDTITAGTDHVDEAWLKQVGIGFSTIPGCNAIAVAEYVFSPPLVLAKRDGFSLHERTVGIIGVGNVGRRSQAQLEVLGIKTLLCDPPRADCGDEGGFRSLDELIQHVGILTFHTPFFKDGPYRTLHLADEKLTRSLKPGVIPISACRGAVIDNTTLLACLSEGQKLSVVLDVWEGELEFNVELLKKADIGTPHTTDYTLEGKARGATQVFEAYSKSIGYERHIALDTLLPAPKFNRITPRGPFDQPTPKGLVYLMCDMRHDGVPLHKVVGILGESDKLHRNYLERRE